MTLGSWASATAGVSNNNNHPPYLVCRMCGQVSGAKQIAAHIGCSVKVSVKVSVNKPNIRVLVECQQEGAQPLLCARECSRVPGRHAFPNAAQRVQHKKMGVDNEKIGKNFFEFLHALASQEWSRVIAYTWPMSADAILAMLSGSITLEKSNSVQKPRRRDSLTDKILAKLWVAQLFA